MAEEKTNPFKEITQPFIDLFHAPRALWGINLAYVIEGMCYFGVLGYLAMHFSDFVFQGVEHADEYSHNNVMILTAGITIAMFFLGFVADKKGVRFALITAFVVMLIGRALMAGAPNVLGLEPTRPGVFAGDKVTLKVSEVGTLDGVKAITEATVVANEHGTEARVDPFAIDLSSGEGMAPNASLESRLVKLSNATVTEGEDQDWKVQYGSAPVTAHLRIHSAEGVGLCPGATISLRRAYAVRRDEDGQEFMIRTHWVEDVGQIDTSACDVQPSQVDLTTREQELRSDSRWPVSELSDDAKSARQVNIRELHDSEDGPVSVVLPDVYVTYVRNGGYLVQASRDGPAILSFVNPVWSRLHLVTILGILLVVVGYGMYQPAAYAGVRQFTTPKTAAMGFAMLYALMNLGGWLPSFAFLLRDEDFLGLGIPGVYWVYTGFTLLALLATFFILTRKTVANAIARAKAETAEIEAAEEKKEEEKPDDAAKEEEAPAGEGQQWVPVHMWLLVAALLAGVYYRAPAPANVYAIAILAVVWVLGCIIPVTARWLARHPLSDLKFFFFIFALIPVQTLFTYNWLILPQYINRAFEGWIGEYFEIAANANPILIFVAVPIIAAITQKAKVYKMMIIGTFVMAAPAFLLVIGPYWWTLAGYLLIMTIGEAMWQPRFLQYAAEIAPEGRTGVYMGVAQLPWFLTKVLVPWLYSGWMMDRYCPAEGEQNTQFMWLVFSCIAMCSTIMLMLAKGWLGKDFKTKAD
ncbi:MAG: MFS transporter [Phycisphaerales bacterium]|nr:MAG: MFS transporter [Phycisphaerales bacterium]